MKAIAMPARINVFNAIRLAIRRLNAQIDASPMPSHHRMGAWEARLDAGAKATPPAAAGHDDAARDDRDGQGTAAA